MTPSPEVIRHQIRVETVERVRELEQACDRAVAFLESHGVTPGPTGWELHERTGITLCLDGVLRCQTNEAGLQPLRFDLIVGDEMILDGAGDDRHLHIDVADAHAVLMVAVNPNRLVFFDNVRQDDERNEAIDLLAWLVERVIELATTRPGPATADQ